MKLIASARNLQRLALALVAPLVACAGSAFGEPIIVSSYGAATSAMPYAVALQKGYFKEFGADVDAIRDADGSAAVRMMAKDGVAYAEVSPAAAVGAARSGSDIRIISGNVYSVAGFAWVVPASSPIHSISDLKGKRLGYSSDGATTDTLNRSLLNKLALSPVDVSLVRAGGLVPELTYLEIKGMDIAPVPEPLRAMAGDKYKTIATAADLLPPIADAVGVTTMAAKSTKSAFIRGVLKARRKAIDYIHQDPADAAKIIALVYKADPAIIERVVRNIIEGEKKTGEPYWDAGSAIRIGPIKNALPGAAELDVSTLIDDSLLRSSGEP